MSDEQSMSVKAYLDMGSGRQEARRFGMPENLATNFSFLKEKICNIFSLGRQDIVITYNDSEGDAIVISSDEELVEAIADSISRQKMQVFRVNVALKSNKADAGNQTGSPHEGVVCDGCGGQITGFRYKCTTCMDYDLCGACEAKGLHKEHKMIRMPKPREKGEPTFWFKEGEVPGGHFAAHFGMHTGAESRPGNTFSYASSSSGGPGGQNGGWCGWGPWMGRGGRPCHRNGGRGHGGWRGWWGKNSGDGGSWQGQGQTTGGFCSQGPQMQQQQGSNQEKQQHQQQQQQQQQQESSNSNDKDKDCPWTSTSAGPCPFADGPPMPNPEKVAEEAQKMAHHVAHHFASQMATDHVANVMRGIWTAWSGQQAPGVGVEIGVGTGTGAASSTHTASTSTSQSTSHSSSTTNLSDNQSEATGGKDQQGKNTTNATTNTSPHEQLLRNIGENVASMLEPLGIDVDVSVENNGIRQRCSLSKDDLQSRQSPTSKTPNATTPPPQASYSTSVSMEVQTDPPVQTVDPMDVASPPEMETQPESDVEEWTMVNRDSQTPEGRSDGGTKPKPTTSQQRVQYPNLQELPTHPDPAIQRALEQMQSMGYNNEGGWLTNLLEMKQGDINQVLDLLQPINK